MELKENLMGLFIKIKRKINQTTSNTPQFSQQGFQGYARVCSPHQLFVYLDKKSPAIGNVPYCQLLCAIGFGARGMG